ncbi:fibronectin type III domain-containing protein [Ferruginibacter sp. SUN002]|uniref:fibronectin type III domain-containing protein n=1 Tax=Ferruginibacter sp. SUN002 TaxID=2937789 RepID=UPI003D35B37F
MRKIFTPATGISILSFQFKFMNKFLSKAAALCVAVLLLLCGALHAQNPVYINTGDYGGFSWNSISASNNLTTASNYPGNRIVLTPSGAGNKYFRFTSATSSWTEYGPTTGADIQVTSGAAPLSTISGASGAWFLNIASGSSNVVFKTTNGAPATAKIWATEVQGAVRSLSGTVQSPLASGNIYASQVVTVTSTLSGALSTGQNAYIRYTKDNFSTSTIAAATSVVGTTATFTIPASFNTSAASVKYYVFTSGATTPTHADADAMTINYDNNSGSNYSYTVVTGTAYYWVGGTGPAAAFNDGTNWSTAGVGGTAGSSGAIAFTTSNILIIDGSDVSATGGLQTGQISAIATSANLTIGQLVLMNSANIRIGALSSTRSYTIGGGIAGADLDIQAGSTLIFGYTGGTSLQTLAIAASNTASIAGILDIGNLNANAAILTIGTANSVTVTSTGTYRHGIASGTFPALVWNTGSTMEVTGLTSQSPGTSFNQTYSNVIWNCSNQSQAIGLGGNLITINGNFSVTNTATFNIRLNAGASSTTTVGGNLNINGGTLALNSANGSVNLNVTGNCNISSGTLTHNTANNTGAPAINIDGNLNISGTGVLDFQLSGSTNGSNNGIVNLKGNLTMTGGSIVKTGTGTGTASFNFAKTGTQTFSRSGTTTISGNQAFVINNGATVDFGTSLLDGGSGTFTLSAGGGIITANTNATGALTSSGANGTIQLGGTRTFNTGADYTFNGASAQVVGNGFTGARALTINNSAGVKLAASTAATVSGTVTLTSGDLDINANTLTLNSAAAAQSITGSGSRQIISTGAGIVSLTGSGAHTITVSGLTGLTFGSTVTVQMNSNATLDCGGNGTSTSLVTVNGTLQLNSTTNSNIANSHPPFYGNASTLEYKVTYGVFDEWKSGTALTTPGVPQNVKINGSGITVTSPTTARNALGNFDITQGTFALSATVGGDINVGGNWTNAGTFTPNSRTVRFVGASGNQTITKFGGETFDYLTINKAADSVLLANSITVNQTLTLTSGVLKLGNNDLTFGTTSGTSTGASTTSYIATNGTGKVIKTHSGAFTYPVGTATKYTPLSITAASSQQYTIGSAATTYSPSTDASVNQWSIVTGGSATSDITFSWYTADAGANLAAAASTGKALQYNGSTWDNIGGTTNTGTPNTVAVTGITAATLTGTNVWSVAIPPAVPDITLADNSGGQVASSTVTAPTNTKIIYNFQTTIATSTAILNQLTFATTNSASDVSKYQLYYSDNNNSFGSASQIGSDITTGLGTGTHTFSSLTASAINGHVGYFWITADVPSGATPGNTIVVTALTTSNLTYNGGGNKFGSASIGGTITIIKAPTVTTDAASAVTTTTVTLNGTINANANSTTASFDWGTTNSYGTNVVANESPVTGTSNTSITKGITGLAENTLYHFSAKGVNAAGTTNGSDATFTTLSKAPTIATATSITSTGFTANWTDPTGQGSETFTITLEVDDDNAFGSPTTVNSIASGTQTYAVSGLSSGTQYYYRVKAVNAGGSSAWSGTETATTSSAVAPTVTTTAISSITENSANTGGNVTSDGGDAVTARGVVYNTTGSPTLSDPFTTNGSGTGSFSSSLSSLSANTTYYVKAYATNGAGTGYGSEVSFVTLATEPGTASTVTFGARTNTSLVVNFNSGTGGRRFVVARATNNSFSFTPTDGTSLSGTISSDFGVADNQGGGDKIVYDGTGNTVTVTGLTANTAYYFAVYEYTNNSASSPNYYLTPGTGNQTTYNPTITTIGTLSAFANTVTGNNSTSQSYTVEGTELASSITVTAPTGYAISLDNSDFSVNPIVLTRDGSDAVSTTTIHVRFSPSSANGTVSANVTNAATDATTRNIAVTGIALAAEPTDKGTVSFGTTSATSIQVDYTLPGSGYGTNRIVVIKAGSTVDWAPTDGAGISGTVSAAFGSATDQGSGNKVVYNGTNSTTNVVTVTGLTTNTTYHFAIYEYNVGSNNSQNYYGTAATGNQTTAAVSSAGDYFRSAVATSGNWNSAASWESSPDNSNWIPATLTPDASSARVTILANDTIVVPNGQSITADSITVAGTGQITIASGGTLTVANSTAAPDLTLNGTILNSGTLTFSSSTASVGSGGIYEHNIANSVAVPTAFTWGTGSTVVLSGTYAGSATLATPASGNYYNVTFKNNISTLASDFINIGGKTIDGKLKISTSGNGAVIPTSTTTVTTAASYEQTSGNFFVNRNGGGTRGLTITGDVDITGGILDLKQNTSAQLGQLTIGGNLNVGASGTLTASGSGTAAMIFNGASAQTWSNAGAFSGTSIGVAVSVTGAGGVTLNSSITLPFASSLTLTSGNFTIASGVTLTMGGTSTATIGGSRTLTVDGTLTRVSSGTFTTTGTLSISNGGKYQHAHNAGVIPTATWVTGSTCEITGNTSTTPSAGLGQVFSNFTWNSPSQTTTTNIGGALTTVNGNFSVLNTGAATNGLRLVNGAYSLNVGGDLIVSAGNTAKLDINGNTGTATINVGGNVTIGSAGTLSNTGGTGVVKLAGNWSNSGTFTNANTTIEFNGSNAQSITKSGGETFNKLTINNSSSTGVTLNNDITVSNNTAGGLTLTDGELITGGSYRVIISGTATTVISGGGTGTFVNGNLQRAVATGTNTYAYPVGNTGEYAPASLAFTTVGTAGNVTVNTTSTDEPNLATSTIDNIDRAQRYWTLTNSGVATYTLAPTFTYNAADLVTTVDATLYKVGKYNSGWTYPTVASATSSAITATGITSLDGNYQAGKNAAVPVVTTDPSSQTICDGAVVTFTSVATGAPTPTIKWQVSTDNGSSWSDVSGETAADYDFTVAVADNNNQYRVIYTNNKGADTSAVAVLTAVATGGWVGPNSGGDWNTSAYWCGGSVPTSADDVTIRSGVNITISSSVAAKSITLESGAGITFSGSPTLSVAGNWTNNSGTGALTAGTGTVAFTSAATVGGSYATTFNNVTTSAALNPGASKTAVNGTISINAGGSITTNGPVYNSGSTLIYNTGANPEVRGAEWTSAVTPVNVQISGNTIMNADNVGGSGSQAATLSGNLTIDAGSAFYMDYGGGSAALTVGNNIILNGNISLGGSSGGDLFLGGNWTRDASSSSVNYNDRAVFFNGSSDQIITLATSGTQAFAYFIIDKPSGNVQLGTGTDVSIASTSGSVLQLIDAGGLDLNGRTFTLSGNGGNILVDGAARNITGTGTFAVTGTKTVTSANSGTLVLGANVTTNLTAAFDPGSSLTTVNGTLQISSGGSLANNTVTYGSASTLVYNQTGTPTFGNEWTGNNTTAGSGVPQNVTIQNGTTVNMPSADRGLAGNLNISNGTLVLNGTVGNDLYVGGNWTRSSSGTFTANDRAVFFNGSNASAISAPSSSTKGSNGEFGGETFPYLIIDKNAKTTNVNLSSNICVTKTLTLTKGTLELNASDLVLPSNATRTADLAQVNPSDADISYSSTGRVVAQRFIGNTTTVRTWRFLTAPLQADDTLSINSAWQSGQVNPDYTTPNNTNPWPGYGTHITGPSSLYDFDKGFDQGTGNNGYSIEYFDNTGATTKLSYPANTKSTRLMSQLGWGLFVRGDRSYVFGSQYTASGNTTLEPRGKINIGTVVSTIVPNKTNVVGNPYPSQIYMYGVDMGGSGFNQHDFKLWDPAAYTNYQSTGRYVFFNWNGSSYDVNNGPTTTWDYPGTVESGEAFLTYNNAASGSTVTFHETDKVTGVSTLDGIQSRPARGNTSSANRPAATPSAKLQLDLQFYNSTTSRFTNLSGSNAYFDPLFSDAVSSNEDNISPVGSLLAELRILEDGLQLSTNRRSPIADDDTVFLYMSKANQVQHRLVVSTKYFATDVAATLIDKYLNTATPITISNTDSTFYLFDITADAQSNRTDRFMIVFKVLNTTPVKFSNVKAAQQNAGIAVQWSVANEVNAKSYEVEKSTDGVHFTKMSTIAAANSGATASYNWLDVSPNTGDNYYRIRLVDQSGAIAYSQIIRVKTGSITSEIGVYPNPVVDGVVGLQLNNMPKGKYEVRIINTVGQTILKKTVQHLGGSAIETLSLGNNVAKGLYKLEVIHPDRQQTVINLSY